MEITLQGDVNLLCIIPIIYKKSIGTPNIWMHTACTLVLVQIIVGLAVLLVTHIVMSDIC
ncbi:hypothetical protein KP509_20G038600 [Ceratopteris richardii]|uniref:Uncharacterized protein n=1 Tax=Ceratopteris richardii TaxID=49495 RepID=A0A8T2SEJ3_CERRI|nr:hypothetical protein KP509_20G038600 [Ceratopteris richardii]